MRGRQIETLITLPIWLMLVSGSVVAGNVPGEIVRNLSAPEDGESDGGAIESLYPLLNKKG